MLAQITLHDPDEGTLRALAAWLRQEPELRGAVTLSGDLGSGDLGPGYDLLTVALGGGGAITVLTASLKTWLSQPRRSDIRVKINGSNGRTVVIDAKRVRTGEVDDLIRTAFDAEGPQS
ncbi:effector-associated constant component EACC1 [Streptomyces rimosus]|uniref:effector-associated constant component EACC1 n=1 Tax=Streptomyces rimosus TaxID=1927 RepID=UPI003CD021F6